MSDSLAVHVAEEPAWVPALVDLVVQAISPHDFFGPLAYRLWEPSEDEDGDLNCWVLAVFPTPYECKGGSGDGALAVPGFTIDQLVLQAAFSELNSVVWHMPTRYNSDLDGPELRLRGTFCGRDVWLRVFHTPPPDEVPTHVYEPATGRCWERN